MLLMEVCFLPGYSCEMDAILIWFDRLPYSLPGCCGNLSTATPNFDRLAAESVAFDQCFAGDLGNHGIDSIADGLEQLVDRGVPVQVVASEETLLLKHLLERGVRIDALEMLADRATLADQVTAAFQERDESERERRRRLTLFTFSGIPDGNVHSGGDEARAAMEEADAALGCILKALPERFDSQSDLILLCAAVGSTLPEGATLERLDEQLIHVPLLGRLGGPLRPGRRSRALVATGDVPATLSEFFAVGPCGTRWDLRTDLLDRNGPQRTDLLLIAPNRCCSLRTPEWHLAVRTPEVGSAHTSLSDLIDRANLYQKPDDIWDQLDVARQFPGEVESLAALLQRRLAAHEAAI
jgi:hypothetical protein